MNGGNIARNQTSVRSVRALLILSLGVMIGCSGTPVLPQTTIYRSGLNHVYLEKDPDSRSNDHPASLTPSEVGSLLRGVRVWKQRNLVYRLFGSPLEPFPP